MKKIPVEEAVGMVLYHDLTEIIPGEFKGPAFKKGHIIKAEDVPRLLNMGKSHIYVGEVEEGVIHENEAAERMARAAIGMGIEFTSPSEGKVTLKAKEKGLLKINIETLEKLNDIDEAMFATLHTDIVVKKGMNVGGTRVIPLVIEETKIAQIEELCKKEGPIVEVLPLKPMKVGIITTGSEVYNGRIEDKFGPVLGKKVKDLGGQVVKQLGIKKAGANIISYGAPTLPGAMFLMVYIGDIPVLGLPACVMYCKTNIFDLILPRVMAGERIEKRDIRRLGHGGFCLSCENCIFPSCGYGKW